MPFTPGRPIPAIGGATDKEEIMENANRTYKDKLFIDYFKDKARLIDAYNALTGSNYPPETEVEITTLENVLYRTQNNDVSFIIDGRIVVLMEHQSTINENMPLRILMYLCEIYKRYVPQKMLYGEKLQKIPAPEFYVFYNGKKVYPNRATLRLSDAYILPQDAPWLELSVPVYNINKGHNEELLDKSAALSDYALFVSLVKDNMQKGMDFDSAVDSAIQHCLKNGIMSAYLENSSEVKRMLITEWNDDEYREVMREEGREEGLEEGLEKGREEGRLEIARKLKEAGVEIALIVKTTGLSEEDVAAL
jgi:hypothetical protein